MKILYLDLGYGVMPTVLWKGFKTFNRHTYLKSYPLSMTYMEIADDVIQCMKQPHLADCKLVVNTTCIGQPVIDFLRKAAPTLAIEETT